MSRRDRYRIAAGRPLPLGVSDCCEGFNFALFSRHAERVELLLFERAAPSRPSLTVDLNPGVHRTGDIWHALIEGVTWGQAYAYRVYGPRTQSDGQRFDSRLLLLDPCAFAVGGGIDEGMHDPQKPVEGSRDGDRPVSLVVDRRFDWQGSLRPRTPWARTVIYETHVRGLTMHPSSGAVHPGTFLGLTEKIGYLRDLGVTAVELMPVQEFRTDLEPALDRQGLRNYWGYDTMAFYAPSRRYATDRAVEEFKTMVRALHLAGIEVLLDVVFNHTAERGAEGPTFNFRGIDDSIYYLLGDKGEYLDFTGCGNTLNCNHPIVRDYVIDCLRYWATDMQVDGFRFDLASILGRNEQGRLMENAPLLERIAEDPILRDVKLIAEAWDPAGAYQVGSFPGRRWAEWNGRFRDDVRRFWRGDRGMTGAFATRLCGSADLYQRNGKRPINSINFVTCHDGFTLNDLVSYERKHNEANGDSGRDGSNDDFSSNYGCEGPTDDPAIESARIRQIKNLLATVLLARGVPMLLGGDEFRRTQAGNNNAYCQDNDLSWYDWTLTGTNREVVRFVREMIALRKSSPLLSTDAFFSGADIAWFGPHGETPDWNGPTAAFGCVLKPSPADAEGHPPAGDLCLLFNAGASSSVLRLPSGTVAEWRRLVDTSNPAPDDIVDLGEAGPIPRDSEYDLGPRALAVLWGR